MGVVELGKSRASSPGCPHWGLILTLGALPASLPTSAQRAPWPGSLVVTAHIPEGPGAPVAQVGVISFPRAEAVLPGGPSSEESSPGPEAALPTSRVATAPSLSSWPRIPRVLLPLLQRRAPAAWGGSKGTELSEVPGLCRWLW